VWTLAKLQQLMAVIGGSLIESGRQNFTSVSLFVHADPLLSFNVYAGQSLSDQRFLWNLTELSKRLAVIGAGSIGLECGQASSCFGSTVAVFARTW